MSHSPLAIILPGRDEKQKRPTEMMENAVKMRFPHSHTACYDRPRPRTEASPLLRKSDGSHQYSSRSGLAASSAGASRMQVSIMKGAILSRISWLSIQGHSRFRFGVGRPSVPRVRPRERCNRNIREPNTLLLHVQPPKRMPRFVRSRDDDARSDCGAPIRSYRDVLTEKQQLLSGSPRATLRGRLSSPSSREAQCMPRRSPRSDP